jgi:peptidoglycan/LPS O-acetylase OafA/YrhL
MLMLLVSLTRDGGKSRTAQALNSTAMKWFGNNSMAIYLVHQVLIAYFACFFRCVLRGQSLVSVTTVRGFPTADDATFSKPNNELSLTEQRFAGNAMPAWGFLVIVPVSSIIGYLITRFIEVPCARVLRSRPTK